eukprot:g7139.t1
MSVDEARLQAITASGGRLEMPSPGTLQRLEDPRAWHASGEGGVQRRRSSAGNQAVALPLAPPQPKGRPVAVKKTVLEEEEYVDRLGEIIEGDYFPQNAKMTRALAGLAGHGPGNTPSHMAGTPSSLPGAVTPGGSTPRRGGQLGSGDSVGDRTSSNAGTGGALTKFVATHTSEDNEAFAELQEKDQEAFRRRYFWAYDTTPDGEGNNATSTKLLILPNGKMMSVERREQMDAACADRPKIGDHRPNQVETWKHRTRNQLMFSPNIVASNDICRIEQDRAVGPLLLKDGTSKSLKAPPKRRLIKQSGETARRATRESATAAQEERTVGGDGIPPAPREVPAEGGGEVTSPPREEHPRRGQDTSSSADSTHDAGEAAEAGETAETAAAEDPLQPPIESDSSDWGDDSSSSKTRQHPRENNPPPARGPPPARVPRDPVVVKTNPKVIQAHATRFPIPAPRQPRRGPWASPIEKPSSSRESVAGLLAGTGDSSGYEEVPMTPSRVPGVDGDSPQITWGSIDGTPMILDPRATPLPGGGGSVAGGGVDVAGLIGALGGMSSGGHQFEVKELPARDKLAHRLEAVDTRRKRAKLGVDAAADGRGTHMPAPSTALTPQTPGTGQRTPATGKRTPGTIGRRTPGGSKTPGGGRTFGKGRSGTPAPSTPAARTLAAKLAQRQSADTPFGGGLTPGRQKRRSSRSRRGSGARGDGFTPLPSTPARSATPVRGSGQLGTAKGQPSSLTDGLLQ